jgi:carboxypeptidase Q
MRKVLLLFSVLFVFTSIETFSQLDNDVLFVKKIHDEVLTNGKCYDWLKELCTKAGPRLSGSVAYDNAVTLTSHQLKSINGVDIKNQKVTVDYWDRGKKEEVFIKPLKGKKIKLNALSIGNSIGTGKEAVEAEIIEVQSLDEVEALGEAKIEGNIVFYNRPMDVTKLSAFSAYGQAGDQRVNGPSQAAEFGAVAVMVRSLGFADDDFPHTGTLLYEEGTEKIPAVAISTNDANKLSKLLKNGPVTGSIKNYCEFKGKRETYNVIGEIKGSEYPDKIILVGGHLDAWDVGQGAHDDGAGCVHAMEVLRTLEALNYKPRHTIRCVLFANEENGLAGALTYAEVAKKNNQEFHTAAIESDAGGGVPRAFSFDADTSVLKSYYKEVNKWLPILEPYGIQFQLGGSGADVGQLKFQKGMLVGLRPDSSRYFDYHHTANDTIEAVHPRELKLGAAAMTSLVYLIDKYFD